MLILAVLLICGSPYAAAYPAAAPQYITQAAAAYPYAYPTSRPCPVHSAAAYGAQCTCQRKSTCLMAPKIPARCPYKTAQKIAEQRQYVNVLRWNISMQVAASFLVEHGLRMLCRTSNWHTKREYEKDLREAIRDLEKLEKRR
jgi:hypothetical protein